MPESVTAWNPWAELARRTHLRLVWTERGRRGCLEFATGEIRIRRAMPRHESRCVLAHELVHDERGGVPRWLVPREERAVRHEAARRLIPLADLARALQWSSHLPEVAEDLGVDVATLRARLCGLTTDERSRLPG
jgi:hypothetical protein